jgi:3-dehydroquinate synthase
LNFGHTFGHALEKVTKYRRFKHGEAVGHGIIFAAELSKKLELLSADEVKSLNGVVHSTGQLPTLHGIDPSEVFEAFKFDKKVIGKSLQWILLKGIGKPVIVSGDSIPDRVLKDTLRTVIKG